MTKNSNWDLDLRDGELGESKLADLLRMDTVEVKFESGSYVQFRLDIYKNTEYLYKKFDAELDKLAADQVSARSVESL